MMLLFSLFCLVSLTAVDGRRCRSVLPYNKLKNVKVMKKSDLLPKNCFVCETKDCSTVTIGVGDDLTRRYDLLDAKLPSLRNKLTVYAAMTVALSPIAAATALASSFLYNSFKSLSPSSLFTTEAKDVSQTDYPVLPQTDYPVLHQTREVKHQTRDVKHQTQEVKPQTEEVNPSNYYFANKQTITDPHLNRAQISNFPLPYMSPNSLALQWTNPYHPISSPYLAHQNIGYDKVQIIPNTLKFSMSSPHKIPISSPDLAHQNIGYNKVQAIPNALKVSMSSPHQMPISSPHLTHQNIGYGGAQIIPNTLKFSTSSPHEIPISPPYSPKIIRHTVPVVQHIYVRQPNVVPQTPHSVKYVDYEEIFKNHKDGKENSPSTTEEEVLQMLKDYASKNR